MRKIILFIAMSLDGYIADDAGNVDWLTGQNNAVETVNSYADFEKKVDTVVMGWTTYHQIITKLSPKQWIYENLQSYIITHKECASTSNITFISVDPCLLVNELKRKEGKDIWICGGSDIICQLMRQNLIDTYYISIIPTILGSGKRLFNTVEQEIKLRLVSAQNNNGIMELIYHKR
jgi:Dihydrofolate reductase